MDNGRLKEIAEDSSWRASVSEDREMARELLDLREENATMASLIIRQGEKLGRLRWQPITPENLPVWNDEVLAQKPLPDGGVRVQVFKVGPFGFEYDDCQRSFYTHRRPINLPKRNLVDNERLKQLAEGPTRTGVWPTCCPTCTATLAEIVQMDRELLSEKWIPCSERMPDREDRSSHSKGVLVWCPGRKNIYMATWDFHRSEWYYFGFGCYRVAEEVTHWMPPPTQPKENTKDADLKPCPLCGKSDFVIGKPDYFAAEYEAPDEFRSLTCKCGLHMRRTSMEDLAVAWNTRVVDPLTKQLAEPTCHTKTERESWEKA